MASHDQIGRAFKLRGGNQNTVELAEDVYLRVQADQFRVVDGTDKTKELAFDVSTLATATTRTDALGGGPVVATDAATIAVPAGSSGTTYLATLGSDTQTFTLPAAAAGLRYTFVCGHASGEILVTPATGDAINIMTFAAVGSDADTARVAPAAGTGIKNTAGSNVLGDNVTLVAVDGTTWYGIGITAGIWASQ